MQETRIKAVCGNANTIKSVPVDEQTREEYYALITGIKWVPTYRLIVGYRIT